MHRDLPVPPALHPNRNAAPPVVPLPHRLLTYQLLLYKAVSARSKPALGRPTAKTGDPPRQLHWILKRNKMPGLH